MRKIIRKITTTKTKRTNTRWDVKKMYQENIIHNIKSKKNLKEKSTKTIIINTIQFKENENKDECNSEFYHGYHGVRENV